MIHKLFSNIVNIKSLFKFCIAIAVIAFLLNNGSLDFYSLVILFDHLQLFIPALFCLFLGIVLSGIRWWLLLGITGNNLTLRTVLSIQLMGSFFSSWLPGAAGGDAVRGVLLFKLLDSGRTSALASIASDRVFAIFGLISIALLSSIFLNSTLPDNETVNFYLDILYYSVLAGIFGCIFLVFSFLLVLHFSLQSYLPAILRRYLSPLGQVFKFYYKSWLRLILCSIISMVASGIVVIGIMLISTMFDFSASPAIAGVIGNVSSVIPVSPGGIGVGEAVFAKIASDLSGTVAPFATIYFTFRIGMLISNIPGMCISVFYSNTKHRKLNKKRKDNT